MQRFFNLFNLLTRPQTSRQPQLLLLTLSLFLSAPISLSHAQSATLNDRNQPITIEADTVTYSDVTQTSVFSGRVILTQGSMQIQANTVEVVIDPQGYQYATAKGGANGLARFRQQRDGASDWMEGQAENLLYDGKTNVISLAKRAQVRRVDSKGQLLDQIRGEELTYNQLTEVFESNVNRKGRTHVIITPRSQDARGGQ